MSKESVDFKIIHDILKFTCMRVLHWYRKKYHLLKQLLCTIPKLDSLKYNQDLVRNSYQQQTWYIGSRESIHPWHLNRNCQTEISYVEYPHWAQWSGIKIGQYVLSSFNRNKIESSWHTHIKYCLESIMCRCCIDTHNGISNAGDIQWTIVNITIFISLCFHLLKKVVTTLYMSYCTQWLQQHVHIVGKF